MDERMNQEGTIEDGFNGLEQLPDVVADQAHAPLSRSRPLEHKAQEAELDFVDKVRRHADHDCGNICGTAAMSEADWA